MTNILKQARTSRLEIHYADAGPHDAPVVFLLHGWPDEISTWDSLAATLNAAGWRTITPYVRGCGPTRFLDSTTPRSGQIAALTQDVLDLADILSIPQFSVVGHDWGARTAYVLGAQAPDRATRIVAMSVGYGSGPLTSLQIQYFWYQWYFGTALGEDTLTKDRTAFCRHIWGAWSPSWHVKESDYQRASAAFNNPDWVAVTLHSYRQRWKLAEPDPYYEQRENRQATLPIISVPALMIQGGDDHCIAPESSAGCDQAFAARYERIVLPGVGHFPQREAPEAVTEHVLRWLS